MLTEPKITTDQNTDPRMKHNAGLVQLLGCFAACFTGYLNTCRVR